MRRSARRLAVVVPVSVTAMLFAGVAWVAHPRVEAADSGRRVVLGGTALPASAEGREGDATGWFAAPVRITNAGLLPITIADPHVVAVDDGARATVRVQPVRERDEAVSVVTLGPGDDAELWVTIGQPGCSPGAPAARVERGVRGVVLDVTSAGITRSVTVDVDVAAYLESPTGVLPSCG